MVLEFDGGCGVMAARETVNLSEWFRIPPVTPKFFEIVLDKQSEIC
jgi:hypothetical protein